jgi:eukaryotic-like serine/threonine-protein kinase
MHVILQVREGPLAGQTFAFQVSDAFVLGRSRRANLRLPRGDRFISRLHFLLEPAEGQCRVMDLGSRNGTYLNGRRIEIADLNDGDCLRAGRTIFRVRLDY